MNEDRIELEARKFAITTPVSHSALADAYFTEDLVRDVVQVHLRRYVYTHRLAQWDLTQEVPKNWFQHLRKQLGLPYRKTVQYAAITRYRTFPDLPYLHPRMGVSFLQEEVSALSDEPEGEV